MKLWLDDKRPAPDSSWTHVHTASAAIIICRLAMEDGVEIEEMSLDHDLSYRGESKFLAEIDTSRTLVNWLEEQVFHGNMRSLPAITIHSSNPVGRAWIERAITSMRRLVVR